MIQIINGIKIKTSTIDEAINLIFKKKKRYRELFLINSLTMNMIERLLLINELIIQKALEDLNVLKKEKTPIYSDDISLKTHPLHQVKEDIEIIVTANIEKIEDTDTAIKDTNELNVNIEGSDKENNNDKSVKKLDINE